MPESLARWFLLTLPQALRVGYPASRRPCRARRKCPVGRWPKRPERSYNRLRLYLFPAIFTSRQELGMQPEFHYPRRSRFAPLSQTVVWSSKLKAPH